jgi:hypothetical protein
MVGFGGAFGVLVAIEVSVGGAAALETAQSLEILGVESVPELPVGVEFGVVEEEDAAAESFGVSLLVAAAALYSGRFAFLSYSGRTCATWPSSLQRKQALLLQSWWKCSPRQYMHFCRSRSYRQFFAMCPRLLHR